MVFLEKRQFSIIFILNDDFVINYESKYLSINLIYLGVNYLFGLYKLK